MTMYKLGPNKNGVLTNDVFVPNDPRNADYQRYIIWLGLGNTALPADEPSPELVARQAEVIIAPLISREWFANHPEAVTFIRKIPAEQASDIDAMTLAQLKPLLKLLTIAVSALIKKEFLE